MIGCLELCAVSEFLHVRRCDARVIEAAQCMVEVMVGAGGEGVGGR